MYFLPEPVFSFAFWRAGVFTVDDLSSFYAIGIISKNLPNPRPQRLSSMFS